MLCWIGFADPLDEADEAEGREATVRNAVRLCGLRRRDRIIEDIWRICARGTGDGESGVEPACRGGWWPREGADVGAVGWGGEGDLPCDLP